MRNIDWQKYLLTFLITALIFGTAFYLNNYFNGKKESQLNDIESSLSLDLQSSETQFDLLKEGSCSDVDNSVLTTELNTLSGKLDYMEANVGKDDAQLQTLKKTYSLLEIRDYLIVKSLDKDCNTKPLSIIYFYSNNGDCPDCTKEGYVLTALREQYPTLRVYSFDYHLDLSAVQTLIAMNKLGGATLPALIIDDTPYYGYKDIDDIKALMPELSALDASSSATSTGTTTSSSTN